MGKLKKSISFVLVLLLSVSMCLVFPTAAGAIVSGEYEYEIVEETDEEGNEYSYAAIIAYTGVDTEITIPDTLDGYTVKTIWNFAFSGDEITSVAIPATVEYFEASAFTNCPNLQTVTVAEDNQMLCSVDSIIYTKDMLSILFYPPAKDTEDFVIPDGVSDVSCQFSNCLKLRSITIPASVEFFSSYEIYGCTNLSDINVSDGNLNYSSEDGVLFDKNKIELIYYPQGKAGDSYTVPNGVEYIGFKAFNACPTLSSLTIPDTVTSIGSEALYDCSNLTEIKFSACLEEIGSDALDGTAWLENQPDGIIYASNIIYRYKGESSDPIDLVIADGTTAICDNAFSFCSFITSVTLPESMQSIGGFAFAFCDALSSVKVDAVSCFIDSTSFYCCNALTNVTFSDGVKTISSAAFFDCTALSEVIIPDSVTYVGVDAFVNTPWYDSQDDGVVYAGRVAYSVKGELEQGASITFKDGTVAVGDYLCENRPISSVIFPDSVKTIGDSAFRGCTGITELVLPKSVAEIGSEAFCDCTEITAVTLPSTLKYIGACALGYYYDDEYGILTQTEGFTISGYDFTAAKQYADDNEFAFKTLPAEIIGDVNGDGKLTLFDALTVLRAAIELVSFDEQTVINTDMNKDGKINVYDAILIQKQSINI